MDWLICILLFCTCALLGLIADRLSTCIVYLREIEVNNKLILGALRNDR